MKERSKIKINLNIKKGNMKKCLMIIEKKNVTEKNVERMKNTKKISHDEKCLK